MPIYELNELPIFPDPEEAENGIVAVGGDLSIERLLMAYSSGIFPWYNDGEPIIWWSPDPRFVLFPEKLKVSKSMKQLLRKKAFRVTMDTAFGEVIRECASARYRDRTGTWITKEMIEAYEQMHLMGFAHSVEVWNQEGQLAGGLYGVALGQCYFGESMFFKESNASKYGFIKLVEMLRKRDYQLIDCQVFTQHLESLGAEHVSRKSFIKMVEAYTSEPRNVGTWKEWLRDEDLSE